ncbi:N-formylglutamate amidohydrolase [Parapedobacter soli]|uniref:N-formylglutamate amidohydrolase n=1 Tax=Parapedobacter soli TaxID=416955 RepID=UPI0021C5C202|nr:N-formylglutamate amidohydrolase [Parapedobacter soli]
MPKVRQRPFANISTRPTVIDFDMELVYHVHKAHSPIIGTAIHDGHLIATPLLSYMHLQEHERFREEDPYTAYMAGVSASRILVETSRFQVDLNRRREEAIYRRPADAWGLSVWEPMLPEVIINQLLADYDRFYADVGQLLQWTIARFGKFVVLDIHSYNHRRETPLAVASIGENPEVNIGTGHNHEKWKWLGQQLTRFLAHHQIDGMFIDVRENVKFKGGGFSEWINRNYGEYGCVLSLEFKKTFMDEWTGRVNIGHLNKLKSILGGCIPFLWDKLDDFVKPVYPYGR